ncbi:uncharacterized protein LOC119654849 [Hermetia illucens]|nr:uncharacterized protein LOC119654849 [Hermetia illucens]
MKTNVLPLILIVQIYGSTVHSNLVDAAYRNKGNGRYNYGYSIKFDRRNASQGHVEQRNGGQTLGNFFVNLPNSAAHSEVDYIANKRGFHPIVRINTKDAHSQVSSHFALGKEAVEVLKELNEHSKSPELAPNKLLTNEVLQEQPTLYVTAPVTEEESTTKPIDNERISKLVTSTYNLVSNEDVFDINGAAEEYFDDISDDRLKKVNFVDKRINDGFAHFARPIVVEEIITNNLPRTAARSLRSDEQEIVISPTKNNVSLVSHAASTGNINIEVLDENSEFRNFGDRISPKQSNVTSVVNVMYTVSVHDPSANGKQLDQEVAENSKVLEFNETRNDLEATSTVGLSESFLAPLQAGLLLLNDQTDVKASEEFEDNILSDSIQNNQQVPNNIETLSEPPPVDEKELDFEEERDTILPPTTLVESYRSAPVIEIIEKGVENNASTKVSDQTYIHAVETHEDNESIFKDNINTETGIKGDFNASLNSPEGPTGIFKPSIRTEDAERLSQIRENVFRPMRPHNPPPYQFGGGVTIFPPIPIVPLPVPISFRVPGNSYHFVQTHHYPPNFVQNENCVNCLHKVVKDDYYGPVPPINEYSLWNTVNSRHQRQLTSGNHPKMEYGFKPPLRPSIEINEQGLPLVKNHH